MPNYRNKNRNRNKNKQRNKQQQQQQQQQKQQEEKDNCTKESEKPSSSAASSVPTGHKTQPPTQSIACQPVTNSPAICSGKNVAEANETTNDKSNESNVCKNNVRTIKKVPDVSTAITATVPNTKTTATARATATAVTKAIDTNDTVLNEPSKCDNKIGNKHGVQANDNMGNEKSKIIDNRKESVVSTQNEEVKHSTVPTIAPITSALGKVIVHRIVYDESNSVKTNKEQTTLNEVPTNETHSSGYCDTESETVNIDTQENLDKENQLKQQQDTIVVHKVVTSVDDLNKQELNTNVSQNEVPKLATTKDDNDKLRPEIDINEQNKDVEATSSKVIVHKVVTSVGDLNKQELNTNVSQNEVHKLTRTKDESIKYQDNTELSSEIDINEQNTDAKATSDRAEESNNLSKGNQAEVIVHKVTTSNDDCCIQEDNTNVSQEEVKVIVHRLDATKNESEKYQADIKQSPEIGINEHNENAKVTANKVEENNNSLRYSPTKEHEVKVIVHKVDTQCAESEMQEYNINNVEHFQTQLTTLDDNVELLPDIIQPSQQHHSKVIVHQIFIEDKDEEPKITSPTMKESLLALAKPSTSEVKIVEVSDESLSDLEELRSPVVSEAESSVEYSDEAQAQVSDSITEVSSCSSASSSSSTSVTTTQKQTRKQKRIALEHHFLPQMLNPRFLDSISEENSELSDNSENSLSRSVSTDSATNCLFEGKTQKLNTKYPKSSLDFSKSHKQQPTPNRKSKVIREEPVAVAVAARLQDAPNADESCTTVRSCMSPESEAAEVVYINSASSSISDLHDAELFENNQATTPEINLDTDLKDIVYKSMTEPICFESLTSSLSSHTSAFTAKIPKQQLPEFCANQSNSYNNNQIINNNKPINNSTSQTPLHTPTATATATETRPLAETDTQLNTNSQSDPILTSSSPLSSPSSSSPLLLLSSSPANDQLVFAQIEEQISSVLSSIDEAASQHHTTTTISTTTTTSSSPSSSSALSSLASKIHTNFSNTQNLPVTTSTTASTRTLQTSCEESFKSISSSSSCAGNNAKSSRVSSQDVNMNTVRDLIINNNKNANNKTLKLNGNNENSGTSSYVKLNYNSSNTFSPIPPPRGSPSPPPIPPPSQEHLQQQQQSHDECDYKPNSALPSSISASSSALPLLQKNVDYHNSHTQSEHDFSQDLKTALSLLTSSVTRQESMDSMDCSDSTNLSQCTAINVATDQSDKSDTVQASLISDLKNNTIQHTADPKKLRSLCTETLASSPYGEAVLEELAHIAQNIGESRAFKVVKAEKNMPYPLPELPHIDDLQLSLKVGKSAPDRPQLPEQDQSWLGVPTTNDPKVLVCLSPSQRSYIQHKPEQKPDDLLDAHQKFVERRGYHEYTKEQLQNLEREKLAEQQLLQTAAIMKKLRKSLTPPPPKIPPPPVPVKSSETASKAQNLSKRTATTHASTHTQKSSNDINLRNDNEQMPVAFNGESNGEENKHRLLSIMQDTNESNASRQTTNGVSDPVKEQVPSIKNSYEFVQRPQHKEISAMQSVESTLAQMFPSMGSSNIFDQDHKRFSNIESSNSEPFCSQIMNTQPKRYSSIETHCFESQKRIENGKVVEDFSSSKHESENSGDKPDDSSSLPLKTSLFKESNNSFSPSGKEQDKFANHRNDQEIMSALNLNKHTSDTERKQQAATQSEKTIKTTTTETSQYIANDESKSAKTDEKVLPKTQKLENNIPKSVKENTYEEFRQNAKAAAANAASTLPSLSAIATAKLTSNEENHIETVSSSISSEATTTTKSHHHETTMSNGDHERLFKEFDDLSRQLHSELETSKAEREQREKSASMFDLNRLHMRQKQQIEEFNKSRHQYLKELEQEIDRSMRSRSLRLTRPQESGSDTTDHQAGRAYEIPIRIENGNTTIPAAAAAATAQYKSTYGEAPPVPQHPKTYQIPIEIEKCNSNTDDTRFRRAESMFNLSEDIHHRQRTCSNQTQQQRAEDDWSKYASDLGSSENIVRPFAKEVEICYQRRPGGIRAPRLTASTNDLSFNNQHSYDQYNAYNVRRHHHAPMLNRAPEKSRPKFGSCYSMIERDPNPKYISTTTRRGVSPAPQPSGFFPLDGCHVREEDMRQRRASLPRELHDQQLKYIASKEEQLRTEFERLQSERRRLMEESQKAQAMQLPQTPISPATPTRAMRDHYRISQKLPTLTEDEVFRQQMAEEWLNKVAEREKRRLQNIIKISKIQEDEASSSHKADMGEEFLSRVKERRHKLAMPADSDWESGAESHPISQAQLSEAEDVPSVKFIEGEQEASLRQLPRHLREFAKFSNHQKENIEGGHREQHQEEERSEETTDNSTSRAFKKSTMVKTVKTLRAPMLPEKHGHGRNQYNNKPNGYQSEPEPNYDSDYSTIKYRTVNPNRLHSAASAYNVRKSNDTLYGTLPNPVKSGQNSYKNQPGRIEDYVTGHSSVSEKAKKEQLDQSKLSSHYTEGNLSRALAKEAGYTSDSNLVFRRKEIPQSSPLSPVEQKQAYKSVQAGGEPPLFGFRKPAPEKFKDYDFTTPHLPPPPKGELLQQRAVSPHRYYESDVNIHFKTPVRQEFKYPLSEEELAIRQAEHMQKLYQEERRRKYLQELQDMNSRRHTDNFTPSQKSPIALNRYDDFPADLAPRNTNQIKSIARALYNFQAQNSKELSFKKGDIIYIKRAIDKNWYEGEHNAMIGLFPANYVEIINRESIHPVQTQTNVYRKPSEGQARAKYNFQAQSGVELSLNKGELVALTRRVDDNWFEGRIANRKGIFPVSYVEVLTDIGAEDIAAKTTTIQQVSVVNARPSLDALRTNINNEFNTLTRNGHQPPNSILRETRNTHKTDILHVDTSSEPLVYRALYKYRPQNSDELELQEGDIVHVLEKCDDGWYVGTSQRTGCFGTFPGNYVERV